LDDDFHKLIRSGKKQTFAKLILTRNGDFIALGGKFPRLMKKGAKARFERNQETAAGDLAPEARQTIAHSANCGKNAGWIQAPDGAKGKLINRFHLLLGNNAQGRTNILETTSNRYLPLPAQLCYI
jgi:hypothetical protein